MEIETLQTLSLVFYILAAVFFVAAIALFFALNISKVIGDLSGLTAKRAIENIRSQNDGTASSNHGHQNVGNTSQMSMSTKLKKSGGQGFAQTSKLATSKLRREAEATTVLAGNNNDSKETTVLMPQSQNETTVLPNETTVLQNETTVLANETTVLQNETTVLNGTGNGSAYNAYNPQPSAPTGVFTIDYEIWYAFSTEIIQ